MNSWKRGWQAILLGALLLGSSWAEAAPIEMQVVEGDVRSVLLSLARTAHENIVLDDSVAGTVTLHVTEEPAKLLRMIAASKGLVLVKEGSTYLVTTMRGRMPCGACMSIPCVTRIQQILRARLNCP